MASSIPERFPRAARRWLVAAAALALAAPALRAQQPDVPDPLRAPPTLPGPLRGPQLVDGQVVTPGAQALVPVGGVWVTLHRVGGDGAGPVDSVRAGGDGRFRITYRRSGDAEAVYFVSTMYRGIAYFTEPLRRPVVRGDDAQILVYDTTTVGAGIHAQGRHLIIGARRDDGAHEVIEVYELSNDSARTVVSPDSTRPVWTTALPDGARGFRVSRGDVAADAMTARDGRVLLFAPISPGLRQLSFAYDLPGDVFPLRVPLGRRTEVLEVLLEDPAGRVTGAHLSEVDPVTLEGRRFKRYLSQTTDSSDIVTVTLGARDAGRRALVVTMLSALFGVAMLLALARALLRQRGARGVLPAGAAAPAPAPGPRGVQALVREIAALDAEFELVATSADAEARSRYETRRGALKERLAAALARERGAG